MPATLCWRRRLPRRFSPWPLPASAEEDVWPSLKQANFGDRAIEAEDGKVVLDAPVTALDASLVPLTVRVPPEVRDKLKSLTLIIDKNPDPGGGENRVRTCRRNGRRALGLDPRAR